MKIALVSDTHGVCRKELFDHIKNCDYLIHTGDFDNERTYNRFLNCGIPTDSLCSACCKLLKSSNGISLSILMPEEETPKRKYFVPTLVITRLLS